MASDQLLDSAESTPIELEQQTPSPSLNTPTFDECYVKAAQYLPQVLQAHDGVVSTMKLRDELKAIGIPNLEDVLNLLRTKGRQDEKNELPWRHSGRSFYTPKAFEEMKAKEEADAEAEEKKEATLEKQAAAKVLELADKKQGLSLEDTTESEPKQKACYKHVEKRLCTNYIKPFLEELYDYEHVPAEAEIVFDVQDMRTGSDLCNVDLIAVDWRDDRHAEIVTVEAKLGFCTKAVMQAASYRRFSHRVWIAIAVDAQDDPQTALRTKNRKLFDYAISLGLGIIICRKAKRKFLRTNHCPMARTTDSERIRKT